MGWLWSSSPKPATADAIETSDELSSEPTAPKSKRDFSLTDEQRQRIFGRSPVSKESHGASQENSDAELEAFLKSFEPGTTASPTIQAPNTSQPPEPTPAPQTRLNPDGTLNIHPTALYQSTMSCRQAFDQAFHCQSLGGKFNDIYRFGHLKDCSEQWGAFWFCMRTRTLPIQDKEGMIKEYYQQRDERRRKERGGSSEDVWELRTKAVERAFWKDPDAEDGDDGGMRVTE